MDTMKLLLVEDNDQELDSWYDTANRYGAEKNLTIKPIKCSSLSKARTELDGSFDGAIIDLKLGSKDSGETFISEMHDSLRRIPYAIYTAHSTEIPAEKNPVCLGIFTKGQDTIEEILDKFADVYKTGLTRIMGGRGEIEQHLLKVFGENIMPQMDAWVKHNQHGDVEKALLRHVVNHLTQLLDENNNPYYPEEVYISPLYTSAVMTGCIVKAKCSPGSSYVVLTPACDLVLRTNLKCKTDKILLVEIETMQKVEKEKDPKRFRGNNCFHYHWLPKSVAFDGGYINFRYLVTLSKKDLDTHYEEPTVRISPPFIKDIVARFSSYYARQGQPEIK